MPHSTADLAMRAPSLNRAHNNTKSHADTYADPSQGATEKFPDFDGGLAPSNGLGAGSRWQNGNGNGNGYTNGGTSPTERWHARRDSRVKWEPPQTHHGHGRQPSITHAIRHMRSGSMSQNAHEIADALRAPVSYKLIVCAPFTHNDVPLADMCPRDCV